MSASTPTSRSRRRSVRPACYGHTLRQDANARPCSRLLKAPRPPITASVLTGADWIGLRAGTVVSKHKTAKHFTTTAPTLGRNRPGIDAGAGPDGTYVISTTVPAGDLDPATVVTACKNQAHPERDLQAVKAAPAFTSFMAAAGHIPARKGRAR